MKVISIALLTLGAALAISPVASAQWYNFTYTTDDSVIASGEIHVSGNNVDSGSATFDNRTFEIFPVFDYVGKHTSPSGAFWYDNWIDPLATNGQYLDTNGLLFVEASNIGELNIWQNGVNTTGSLYFGTAQGSYSPADDVGTFSVTPANRTILRVIRVSEEGGLSMLILSALTLAGCFFFKTRQAGLLMTT